jgi:hypothetical protein
LRDGSSDLPITEQDVEAARVHDAHQRSLSLNESDPDEREALRGPVSASRAVLDGQRGAPRIREDDERLRRARLAAIELQGVVEGARLSGVEELLMLVRYLPGSFINAYLSMIDAAFGERALGSGTGAGVEGSGREYGARSGVATKSEVIGHRDGAHWSGKSSADVGIPIRSEKASEELSRLKKRLRGMAREILVSLSNGDTEPVSRRRCSGRCARLGDVEWLFCPNCGGPMSDVVKKKNRS